jgi:hypothetical protein
VKVLSGPESGREGSEGANETLAMTTYLRSNGRPSAKGAVRPHDEKWWGGVVGGVERRLCLASTPRRGEVKGGTRRRVALSPVERPQ